jgi:DEAD/DEAH box helicase domain-containing protein
MIEMDIVSLLAQLQLQPFYHHQIVHIHEAPGRPARFADVGLPLHEVIETMLARTGSGRLYTHQAEAIDRVRAGQDIVVTTGPASGKSLCYVVPILEMLLASPRGRALLLFPTKALCQDQFQRFSAALESAGLTQFLAGVYDADTPAALRRRLRDQASVIFTNPDMLHAGIMPQHSRWAPFLASLQVLAMDEIHTYSGIFGSNMGNLLRRFFRVCRHYGSRPGLVACSATIANPGALVQELTGRPVTVVGNDGSPCGRRFYVLWNPPVERSSRWRSRRSANVEGHELMAMLIREGVPTITFSKAKMSAEMISRYVVESLQRTDPYLANRVTPYRGGYLPEERRAIEQRLFQGDLIGVSTTPALELGIDVGCLDASIMVGYPGTLSSFFQQAGRAGRAGRDSLSVLVGLDTPINQYILAHPEYLFGRPIEEAVIDPHNPFVLIGHLRCAVHELALPDAEVSAFGESAPLILRVLQDSHKVRHIREHWYHAASEIPQHEVSLRSFSDATVMIEDADTGAIIGELDQYDAPPIIHPEAIYMHGGDTYRVLSLDMERNLATVKREDVDYYTQPLGGTDVHHIDHCLRQKPFGTGTAFWGEVTAYFESYGYEKIHFYSLDAISRHGVDLPPLALDTMALWIVPPEALMVDVRTRGLDPHRGLRAIGYAARMMLPLFATCDTSSFSHSVGCINAPWNALFIYERYPLGLGFTEKAYERLHEILPAVLEKIRACECYDGCPCCVGKPLRGETVWNVERGEGSIPSKAAAIAILNGLLGDHSHLDAPDVDVAATTDIAAAARLEAMLRRRLERMREPQVFHQVELAPRLEPPPQEDPDTLIRADSDRRSERRRSFDRELRKRISRAGIPVEARPNIAPAAGDPRPARQAQAPSPEPPAQPQHTGALGAAHIPEDGSTVPIPLGDPLSARARRLARERDKQRSGAKNDIPAPDELL